MLEQEGLEWVFGMGWGAGWGGPIVSQSSRPLLIGCLHEHQQWLPSPCSDAVLGLSWLCPLQLLTFFGCGSLHLSVELCLGASGLE